MKAKKNNVQKPTDECFGSWIVDDVKGIRDFMRSLKANPWSTSMKEYEFAWYSAGDLMFKNEDVCHFRMVAQDLMSYCDIEETPSQKKKGKKQLTQES